MGLPATFTTTPAYMSNAMPHRHKPILQKGRGVWSTEEHDRFLEALKLYPRGPWRSITEHVGTRSIRQVQTHAQKYQEKIARRLRGVPKGKKLRLRREHRIDHDVLGQHTLISVPAVDKLHPPSPQSVVKIELDHVVIADLVALAPPLSPKTGAVDEVSIHEESMISASVMNELPSLGESLDFFIDCFSC